MRIREIYFHPPRRGRRFLSLLANSYAQITYAKGTSLQSKPDLFPILGEITFWAYFDDPSLTIPSCLPSE